MNEAEAMFLLTAVSEKMIRCGEEKTAGGVILGVHVIRCVTRELEMMTETTVVSKAFVELVRDAKRAESAILNSSPFARALIDGANIEMDRIIRETVSKEVS
jgi:hypothetical protein